MAFRILVNDISIHLLTFQKPGGHLKTPLFPTFISLLSKSSHNPNNKTNKHTLRKLEIEGTFLNLKKKGNCQRIF